MKFCYLPIIVFIILIPATVCSQVRSTNQQARPVAQASKPSTKTFSNTSDSLKMALNDVKTSFNTLFKARRDTISIMIQNIEYDDNNLSVLKDYLKKTKGVKAVLMQYKAATALVEVMFKGKSTELWDELPKESKEPFKLIEANDNNITLQYKGH
jgi:hypothetical protein